MSARTFDAKLQKLERSYGDGDKSALATALLLVVGNNLAVPPWVTLAFVPAFADVMRGRVKSWDDVLGRPHKKGKHLYDARRRAELCFPVWEAGQRLKRHEHVSVGPALWARLADEFEIGARLASELYYRVEKVVNEAAELNPK